MADNAIEAQTARCASWPERFPPHEWLLYKRVLHEARRRAVPFAVGGGLAAMTYAGQWRNTKDLDLYIMSRHRQKMIDMLSKLGFEDYHDRQSYDRKWIYRAYKNGNIVDLIWAMANQRASVDESWFEGPEVAAGGERFRLLAPEEALWSKIYVFQHDRCDWPDALNVLYGVGPAIDWRRVLRNFAADAPLLSALLSIFAWLSPGRAQKFPSWLWDELRLRAPQGGDDPAILRDRAHLLDSRPWFTPTLAPDESPQ